MTAKVIPLVDQRTTIVAMARRFKGSGHIVRFIEFMDVGASNGWRMNDVVPSAEIVRMISAEMPLIEAEPNYTGEVAERWAYADGSGEIGVISSVTQASAPRRRSSIEPCRDSGAGAHAARESGTGRSMTAWSVGRIRNGACPLLDAMGRHVGNLKWICGVWKFKAIGYDESGQVIPGGGILTDRHNTVFDSLDLVRISRALDGA